MWLFLLGEPVSCKWGIYLGKTLLVSTVCGLFLANWAFVWIPVFTDHTDLKIWLRPQWPVWICQYLRATIQFSTLQDNASPQLLLSLALVLDDANFLHPGWLPFKVPSAAAHHLCTAITGVGAPSPCWEGAGSLSHSISRAGKIPSSCFPSQQATLWPVWHRYSVMCQLRLCQMNSRVWSEGCRKIYSLSRKTFLMETAR